MTYTYFYINIFTILFPLSFSFGKKIHFYRNWKYLFPALFITALCFLIWDFIFTQKGIWGFNDEYITGIKILNLPVEEVLFFFTIPYACIFIYEVLKYYCPTTPFFERNTVHINYILLAACLVFGLVNYYHAYSLLSAAFALFLIVIHTFFIRSNYMGRFYLFYCIHLIPFFVVNSLLTGSLLNEPVVWYNNVENSGIRIGTIPLEDVFYSLSLMLMNISIYEYFKKKVVT